MKRYIYYVWLLILLSTSGCSNFLEEYSKDQVYAASCEDLDEALIGSGYMPSNATLWQYSCSMRKEIYYPFLFVMDDDTEELITGTFSTSTCVYYLRNFYTWQKDPFIQANTEQTKIEDHTIKKLYEHIAYANTVISYVDQFPNDPLEDRMRIRGEGQFLRAAYYLMANNLYGRAYNAQNGGSDMGVPLKEIEWVVEDKFARTSVKNVYKTIVNSLQGACENLRGVVQKNVYRADQLAARILLSRAYLYMEDYENVITQCDSAITLGCPLMDLNTANLGDDYKKRDYSFHTSNPEIVFTMGDAVITTIFSPFRSDQSRYATYRASSELVSLFKYDEKIQDIRQKAYIHEHNTARGSYGQCKLPDYSKSNIRADVFEAFLIRTVEVYLNKAEAQAMTGDIAGAVNTLQPLLNARYVPGKLPQIASLGEKDLVNFIRDERRRELCFEGHRWPDLKRYAVNTKYPLKKEIRHTVYTTNDKTGGTYAGYYTLKPYGEEDGWILPFPENEIIFNEGILVNPERPDRPNEDENFREK